MSLFRDKIKAVLVEALHTDPAPALHFVESFSNFKDDYERKEMWELELAVREVYKGPLPFVWSQWDYGLAWPTVSYEYETNWRAVQDFEKLCVFIKEIKYYID